MVPRMHRHRLTLGIDDPRVEEARARKVAPRRHLPTHVAQTERACAHEPLFSEALGRPQPPCVSARRHDEEEEQQQQRQRQLDPHARRTRQSGGGGGGGVERATCSRPR